MFTRSPLRELRPRGIRMSVIKTEPIVHHVLLSDFGGDETRARGALQTTNWQHQAELRAAGVRQGDMKIAETKLYGLEGQHIGYSRSITYEL